MLSEIERAQIAMLIDTEGSVGISTNPSMQFMAYVHIANTSLELMEWLAKLLNRPLRQYIAKTGSQVYQLRLSGVLAKELLELIEPYMIVKKRQAQIILSFPVTVKGSGFTEEIKFQQALCYIQIQGLNSKGRREVNNGECTDTE